MSSPSPRPPAAHRPRWLQALSLGVLLVALLAVVLVVYAATGAGRGAWIAAGACAATAFGLLVLVGLVAMRREARRAGTTAYDLVVGAERAVEHRPDGPTPVRVGWAGPEGPAIDPGVWPRSPRTDQPMIHCATFELPPAYRRRGPELVAISVFTWADEVGFWPPPAFVVEARADRTPDDPFWQDVARARPHPESHVLCDQDTGCFYAVVFLTEAELTGARTRRPRQGAVLDEGERGYADEDGAAERRRVGLFGDLYRVERDDPNAGLAPADHEEPGDDSVTVLDADSRFSSNHVGGTFMDPFGLGRRTASPWYVELHRLGGLWVGDDENLLVDLAADEPIVQR